ncbi:MAG: PD-(D/E)XK nuclease family protein [Candidatus Diapherotrites archaeon]|nr:PD-(D/E)XK nuclease family protein [Candidatus Diapherotrites archaeon]
MNYSHSRISCFENCKLAYKFRYIDRVKVDIPTTIECFMGSQVHDALEKLYKDKMHGKDLTKKQVLDYYEKEWKKNYKDTIKITKKEYTANNYKKQGKTYIEEYYNSYHPFNQLKILGLETSNFLKLGSNTYSVRIDKLAHKDDTYYICDYKTNSAMLEQDKADKDRQLAMYCLWVKQKYPDAKKIVLLWHMLKFGKEVTSVRTNDELKALRKETIGKINEIVTCKEFLPNITRLCDWCVYKHLCPSFKHEAELEEKTVREFRKDEGVKLVDELARVKEETSVLKSRKEELENDLVEYSKQHEIDTVFGSKMKASVKEGVKLEWDKTKLEKWLKKNKLYEEYSSLNTFRLNSEVKKGNKKLDKFAKKDKSFSVRLSKGI